MISAINGLFKDRHSNACSRPARPPDRPSDHTLDRTPDRPTVRPPASRPDWPAARPPRPTPPDCPAAPPDGPPNRPTGRQPPEKQTDRRRRGLRTAGGARFRLGSDVSLVQDAAMSRVERSVVAFMGSVFEKGGDISQIPVELGQPIGLGHSLGAFRDHPQIGKPSSSSTFVKHRLWRKRVLPFHVNFHIYGGFGFRARPPKTGLDSNMYFAGGEEYHDKRCLVICTIFVQRCAMRPR